ncbi:M48 family metalloprotease [Coralliovum pocilloporae]|uniref:M48 family metalloprotease n=1 Tax=Coralliovum pocilloporae TaxID=3066369 RepID=UPI0033076339
MSLVQFAFVSARLWRGLMLSLLAVALLSGCQTLSGGFGPVTLGDRTQSRDARIGRQEHPKIVAAYGGIYENAQVERSLGALIGRLVAASDNPAQNYQITLLNSPVVNAFALPGGYVYVTRGLLALSNDLSEIGAVIAHEMAHVTERHGIAREDKVRNTLLASKILSTVSIDSKTRERILKNSKNEIARFSQAQELAADKAGIRTLARAGLDPYGASRFLMSLDRYSSFRAGSVRSDDGDDFLMTHPSTPNRIRETINFARSFSGPEAARRSDDDRFLKSLDGVLFGDDSEEGYVRGSTFFHADLRIRFDLPAGSRIENTPRAVFATTEQGTAIRFDGVDVPIRQTLADYIQSGWIKGLDRSSIRTRKVEGLPVATADARRGKWAFRIALIRIGTATYRFLFATKTPDAGFFNAADSVVQSFRRLSLEEAASLKPLRIRVVEVPRNGNVRPLVRRMRGVAQPARLFRILNGISASNPVKPGQLVKIVSE